MNKKFYKPITKFFAHFLFLSVASFGLSNFQEFQKSNQVLNIKDIDLLLLQIHTFLQDKEELISQ